MAAVDITENNKKGRFGMGHASRRRCCRCDLSRLAALMLFFSANSMAAKWVVDSSVLVTETFSDNIELSKQSEEETYAVTNVNPTVSMSATGRRLEMALHYFPQYTDYSNQDVDNSITHSYTFIATAEPIRDAFSLDASANRRQLASRGFVEKSIRLLKNDVSYVDTYSISPRYKAEISGEILADLSYSIQQVRQEEIADQELADYDSYRAGVILSNAKRNSRLKWRVSYSSTVDKREGRVNSGRANGEINFDYQLYKDINYVAVAGYEESDINPLSDGNYQSVGLAWLPSERFELKLYAGRELRRVFFKLQPSSRTNLSVTWTDTNIGLIRGENWTGSLDVRAKYLSAKATRVVEVLSFQQLLSRDNQIGQSNAILPDIDSIFIRSRNDLIISTKRPKLNLAVNLYTENREFIENNAAQQNNDSVANASSIIVSWKASSRFIASVVSGVEEITSLNAVVNNNVVVSDDIDRFNFTEISLTYNSGKRLNLVANLKKSTGKIVEAIETRDFVENRASLSISFSF